MENYNNTILLPHNQEAFQKVMEHFQSNKRAAVVHATGTGKSFIIAAVASRFAGRVVIVAPNTFVLDETRKLCGGKVDFRTYALVMYDESPAADYELIVLDEFHRAGAEEWGKGVDRLLTANPDAKVLGTSATAIRYLDGQRNMSDELFDGNVVSSLPLREAIDRGIIPEPTYVASLYAFDDTYAAVKQQIMASNKKSEGEKMKAMRTLDGIAHNWENAHGVGLIMRKYLAGNIKRIIVFCSSVSHIEDASDILKQWFSTAGFHQVHFYNIDYQKKNVKREMEKFQRDNSNGIKVALSVNMLNEGIHVEDVDAVIMMRSSISPTVILQQIGRCLTAKNTGRKPVIIDLVNNMDTLGKLSLFTFGWSKSNAAEKTDSEKDKKILPFNVIDNCCDIRPFLEQVNTEFDVVTDFYPKFWEFIEKNGRLPKYGVKEEMSLYKWCGGVWNNMSGLTERFPDVYAKLKELRWGEIVCIRTEKKASDFLELFNKYNRLPLYNSKEEKSLYYWCGSVWSNRNGLADKFPEVYNILKKMNFGHIFETQTNKRYKLFWEFVEKNGRLPKYSVKEESSLYYWCRNVWGNVSNLKQRFPEVYSKLKELRFGESVTIKTESIAASFWEFIEKYGRLPKTSVKEERNLYNWCRNVYANMYGLADKFPEVYNKLKEMKFGNSFDVRNEVKQNEFFDFVEKNGRLPKWDVKEEMSLYKWCERVWNNDKGQENPKRFPEVYAKLKELKWGKNSDSKTEKKVEEFWEFVEKNGRLPKWDVKEESSLYTWCSNVVCNKHELADRFPDVYNKLKDMGWTSSRDKTQKRVDEFREFIEKNGRLPKKSVKEEKGLYSWCRRVWHNDRGLADKHPDVLAKIKELKEKSEA